MRRGLAARGMVLLGRERGALLWVPGLLLGTSLILFGIHQAPQGMSLFTHTTGVRIVIGAWTGPRATVTERGALVGALRRGLERHGALAVVDSTRVARRLLAAGAGMEDGDSSAYLLAIRALNPHLALQGRVESVPGSVHAWLEAWDVHAGECSFRSEASGATAVEAGAALAESVSARVFTAAGPAHFRRP
jgi:hypothetical protein